MVEAKTPASRIEGAGTFACAIAVVAWVALLGRIASHRVYVGRDSLISYAHVWYISDQLWHRHRLPLRMPIVSHGDGLAFPYGAVSWTVAALLRPVLGDWATTLVLVLSAVTLIVATYWAFPELRKGWWAVAVLANPAIITGVIIGQIPFLGASALLMLAVGAWRRDRTVLAIIAAGLAQLTHPAVVVPLTFALVAVRLVWEPRRRTMLLSYGASVVIASPAILMVVASPVFGETSSATKIAAFVDTLAPRCLVIVVPVALVLLQRLRRPLLAPASVLALCAALAAMWSPLLMAWAWGALNRNEGTQMVAFTERPEFVSGATYRVLQVGDGRVGMYQLLQAGGRLDSEFFPESIENHSWGTLDDYMAFLRRRHVDFVMLWQGYDGVFHTNEHRLLEQAASGTCASRSSTVRLVASDSRYALYAVVPC